MAFPFSLVDSGREPGWDDDIGGGEWTRTAPVYLSSGP